MVLLDIVPPGTDGSRFKAGAEQDRRWPRSMALKKAKPAAFYAVESRAADHPGNFEDDMALIADCDWIIEAVAENLEIKHALYAKVLQHRRADSILTTNTSGLPIASSLKVLPDELTPLFFGTHFFNPPRYMRLLEIIPLAQSPMPMP